LRSEESAVPGTARLLSHRGRNADFPTSGCYSTTRTLVVLLSIPALLIRPILREKIKERFDTGAASQQFCS
jgi:hypothetical protein